MSDIPPGGGKALNLLMYVLHVSGVQTTTTGSQRVTAERSTYLGAHTQTCDIRSCNSEQVCAG